MKEKKRMRFKKFNFHPVTSFVLMTCAVIIISAILSSLGLQSTYSRIDSVTFELEPVLVNVENMLTFSGLKYIFGEALRNFISFAPLGNLLLGLIGIAIAHASGLMDTFIKRHTIHLNNKVITFLLIFVAVISSIINDVGYVILIPVAALIFAANKRNPLLGVTTAFCGVAFGYGATLFAGSMEIALVPITESAARLIDNEFHVGLLSNLFIIIATSIIISIVGTIVIEGIIVKRIGKYKTDEDDDSLETTKEIEIASIAKEEQKRLEIDIRQKKGLKYAFVTLMCFLLLFGYMIIPNLPFSGWLLDMNESAYVYQLFGSSSYFQQGFTFMISLLFSVTGIAYAIGAKSLSGDKELIEKMSVYLKDMGYIIIMLFVASQFIMVFRRTNIGLLVLALFAKWIEMLSFSGVTLIIFVLLVVAICNFFNTTPVSKWTILAPVVVPLMMQSNISPQFTQFIFRAGDSMTKGFTPLFAYFVIYLAYLNIYNRDNKPITIKKAMSYIAPYCGIIGITWLLIVVGWYLVGLPIGSGVFPTL